LIDVFIRERNHEFRAEPTVRGTHWEALAEAWSRGGSRLTGFRPSFWRDILPILEAAARIPYVFDVSERVTAHMRFSPDFLARLGGKGSDEGARLAVFARVRAPDTRAYDLTEMPLSHGDFWPLEGGTDLSRTARFLARWPFLPRTLLTLSPIQYALLRRWGEGDFDADYDVTAGVAASDEPISALGLDRAALEHAVGGSFFPGIEASWLSVDRRIYASPFRLDAGAVLRSRSIVGRIAIQPGFLSAQMALPWHADFASCRKTASATGLTQVAWWPSQRPDDVLAPVPGSTQLLARRWAPYVDTGRNDNERHQRMRATWSRRGFVVEDMIHGIHLRDEQPDPPP
jgi:hypothetical protein